MRPGIGGWGGCQQNRIDGGSTPGQPGPRWTDLGTSCALSLLVDCQWPERVLGFEGQGRTIALTPWEEAVRRGQRLSDSK